MTTAAPRMAYAPLPGLGREVSRLVLGTTVLIDQDPADASALLHRWLDLGGNIVDTAHEYGYGLSERALGRWLAAGGRRDEVVILTKGGHPYDGRWRVTPEDVTADLHDSLERLGVEAVDLLLLHRDDARAPVGPLLEILNEHRRAGLIGAFGASNWSTARLADANAYAAEHGLEPFACSSPQLSLAVQRVPAYPDTVSAGDRSSRAWYARTRLPVFAWSAQAGGWFTDGLAPDDPRRPALERVYGSDENRERRRRAEEAARRHGATTNQIALAWVLHQPFPTYAIIGPRTVAELESSVAAVAIDLTEDEVRRLSLDDEA